MYVCKFIIFLNIYFDTNSCIREKELIEIEE